MVASKDDLLMTIFKCGSLDLALIDGVGYDFCDIIEQLWDSPIQEIGINGLMRAVVNFGTDKIREAVDDRICELEAIPNDRDLDEDEERELAALRLLNPDEDIQSYHNCIDTHVWFEHNGPTYRKYLDEAVDDFEKGTGLHIDDGWH